MRAVVPGAVPTAPGTTVSATQTCRLLSGRVGSATLFAVEFPARALAEALTLVL